VPANEADTFKQPILATKTRDSGGLKDWGRFQMLHAAGRMRPGTALRLWKWHWPQQHTVYHREYGGVGADAEGERKHGSGSEARDFLAGAGRIEHP